MSTLLIIDGNSIMNRAFYGIMGSRMLTTKDGTYTNAVYGFLSILFKVNEELCPDYMAVAFDLKAPTARHKLYEGYKANRKGMPNELVQQMPIIKNVLSAMNIKIIEKEGYEADDVLGTLSKMGEKDGINVTILSGDRDTFQLATDKVTIRIPRTKAGKTEEDFFDRKKVIETYGVEPKQLIEVKGLMGDTSDNIPGVPGVGEKTALKLIQEFGTIENLYAELEKGEAKSVKGKIREKIIDNRELADLSKFLGTINLEVPIEEKIDELKVAEWNKEKVLEIFRELRFNRFIERFNLSEIATDNSNKSLEMFKLQDIDTEEQQKKCIDKIQKNKKLVYFFGKNIDKNSDNIIKKTFTSISIYDEKANVVYYMEAKDKIKFLNIIRQLFEDSTIEKYGFSLNEDYVMLAENNIKFSNIVYDGEIAGYVLNPVVKPSIDNIVSDYLSINIDEIVNQMGEGSDKTPIQEQISLFDDNVGTESSAEKQKNCVIAYSIGNLYNVTMKKLEEIGSTELFNNIEMPLIEVLAQMQLNGIYADKDELIDIGNKLKGDLAIITNEIYELAGEEFNINSHQQLGKILFEKLQLPCKKKTKQGYSTDVDILEKIKKYHPIVEKVLEYRSLTKLNSTYVEGLLPFINKNTNKIHSFFHQTITATGRISSTEPNLQNIPTRIELGKTIRKVFKPKEGYIFIDADYSQVELRVLAHISKDENMIEAFLKGEDIHKQAASKVLGIPIEQVTKEQRSSAKAVNFGIVYGISEFGLAEQLGISRKQAKEYINQYLEKYSGIKSFMDNIVEQAKKTGYVETLFHRRRYIPELSSNNYMVRQFGARAAMNTPIQGTAADIMKIAMVNVYNELKQKNIDARIVLQIHDELLIECNIKDKEEAARILKYNMENAIKMSVPLNVETSEATSWYDAK